MRHATRRDRPHVRVARALWRLSRDRWLHPDECARVCRALSVCAAHNSGAAAQTLFKHSMDQSCLFVGMIRGARAFNSDSSVYREFICRLRDGRKLKNPELYILTLTLKEIKNVR